MEKSIKKLIAEFGRTVTVYSKESEYETKAFIQPLRYKNKLYLSDTPTYAGISDDTSYLYIGNGGNRIGADPKLRIKAGDTVLFVVKSEPIYISDVLFYEWAVLKIAVGGEQ